MCFILDKVLLQSAAMPKQLSVIYITCMKGGKVINLMGLVRRGSVLTIQVFLMSLAKLKYIGKNLSEQEPTNSKH